MRRSIFLSKEHLKKSALIKQVFDKGVPFKGRLVTLFFLKKDPCEQHENRVAFICRKSTYNKKSVLRNRYRRLLREAYRNTKHLLSGRYDIIILGTRLRKNIKSPEIEKEVADGFKKYSKKQHKNLS